MTLTLRKTVIGGKTAPGDYVVLEDGRVIGRIMAGIGTGGQPRWSWYININDPTRIANGWESTLDNANASPSTRASIIKKQSAYALELIAG